MKPATTGLRRRCAGDIMQEIAGYVQRMLIPMGGWVLRFHPGGKTPVIILLKTQAEKVLTREFLQASQGHLSPVQTLLNMICSSQKPSMSILLQPG